MFYNLYNAAHCIPEKSVMWSLFLYPKNYPVNERMFSHKQSVNWAEKAYDMPDYG